MGRILKSFLASCGGPWVDPMVLHKRHTGHCQRSSSKGNRSSGKGRDGVRVCSGFAFIPTLKTLRSAPSSGSPPTRCLPPWVEACREGSYGSHMSDKVRNMHRWVARRGHAGQGWCACMCDARYAYLSPSEKRQPASQSGKSAGQRPHFGDLPRAGPPPEIKYVRIYTEIKCR